jgi:predicted nucleic acid-binding protein
LAGLDSGEAAVIQLALELEVPWVAIDEWKGRRAALAVGLQVTGTLGLLGRAKVLGLIPSLKPLVERATAEGIRYHPELVQAVLKAAGE